MSIVETHHRCSCLTAGEDAADPQVSNFGNGHGGIQQNIGGLNVMMYYLHIPPPPVLLNTFLCFFAKFFFLPFCYYSKDQGE
jgi:hypothetical protein